ncbi:hypothetical protein N7528_009834 [Penicillium herquei]|nr:hypothetical protein N7528_009834 [Penicillium herquei]
MTVSIAGRFNVYRDMVVDMVGFVDVSQARDEGRDKALYYIVLRDSLDLGDLECSVASDLESRSDMESSSLEFRPILARE